MKRGKSSLGSSRISIRASCSEGFSANCARFVSARERPGRRTSDANAGAPGVGRFCSSSENNGSSGNEEASLFHVLILAARAFTASGDIKQGETLLLEAREKAVGWARDNELTDAIPLATAERALGEFYSQQRRLDEARACYQRLNQLWQSFPDTNDYVQIQRSEALGC